MCTCISADMDSDMTPYVYIHEFGSLDYKSNYTIITYSSHSLNQENIHKEYSLTPSGCNNLMELYILACKTIIHGTYTAYMQ